MKLKSVLAAAAVLTLAVALPALAQQTEIAGDMVTVKGSVEAIEEALRPGGTPPQDRVGDISDFSAAKQLLFSNRALPALELIRGMVAKDPENPFYRELEATANLQLGRLDAAMASLEEMRRQEEADRAGRSRWRAACPRWPRAATRDRGPGRRHRRRSASWFVDVIRGSEMEIDCAGERD